jgi:hypothetical protein
MDLDDLQKEQKMQTEEGAVEVLADELGIEDKEDLEQYDDKLQRLAQTVIAQDRKIERLEEKVETLQRTVLHHIKDEHGDNTNAD